MPSFLQISWLPTNQTLPCPALTHVFISISAHTDMGIFPNSLLCMAFYFWCSTKVLSVFLCPSGWSAATQHPSQRAPNELPLSCTPTLGAERSALISLASDAGHQEQGTCTGCELSWSKAESCSPVEERNHSSTWVNLHVHSLLPLPPLPLLSSLWIPLLLLAVQPELLLRGGSAGVRPETRLGFSILPAPCLHLPAPAEKPPLLPFSPSVILY